jgi:SnoaL-like domain
MTADTHAGTHAQTITRFFEAIAAGDSATLLAVLTPDAVTHWPQSGERITGAMSCVRVYENYPGGPPSFRFVRISGAGDTWVAEMELMYGDQRWYGVSIVEFDGPRIARMTDYFGSAFPAPAWRAQWVERDDA